LMDLPSDPTSYSLNKSTIKCRSGSHVFQILDDNLHFVDSPADIPKV